MMKPASGVIQLWKKSVAQFSLTPPGTELGFENKSFPDEQQWQKQKILFHNLITQIASICIDPISLC